MERGLTNLSGKACEGKSSRHIKKENKLTKTFCLMIYIYNISFFNYKMAFQDTLPLPLEVILPVIAAIASFSVAAAYTGWVAKQKPGTKEMLEISNAVRQGAAAFLKREMKIIVPIAIGLSVIIGFFIGESNGIAFAVGATLSAVAGFISLKVTVKAAVRAANATSSGLGKTFAIAFRGGATVGLAVPAMALVATAILYMIYPNPITIAGVGIGASLIALFIRIGGGIFTKAADMGADLVGKVEANIPEDDPRNPATIADNVGDNVGDAAGMGSDVYESYIVTILASLLIAALIGSPENLCISYIDWCIWINCFNYWYCYNWNKKDYGCNETSQHFILCHSGNRNCVKLCIHIHNSRYKPNCICIIWRYCDRCDSRSCHSKDHRLLYKL